MENQEQLIADAVKELKDSNEAQLKETIEKWFEQTRTSGMRIGAQFIAAGAYGIMQKHLKKPNPSRRDYERMTDELLKMFAVQLKQPETQQTNSETEE